MEYISYNRSYDNNVRNSGRLLHTTIVGIPRTQYYR